MNLCKLIPFMLLVGICGQASAGLEAIVDLSDGTVITEDLDNVACKQHCLEVHRIGTYMLYVLRDTEGLTMEPHVLPILEESNTTLSVDGVDRTYFSANAEQWGTCEPGRKSNCVEVATIPGGYIIIIHYGIDGAIQKIQMLPINRPK